MMLMMLLSAAYASDLPSGDGTLNTWAVTPETELSVLSHPITSEDLCNEYDLSIEDAAIISETDTSHNDLQDQVPINDEAGIVTAEDEGDDIAQNMENDDEESLVLMEVNEQDIEDGISNPLSDNDAHPTVYSYNMKQFVSSGIRALTVVDTQGYSSPLNTYPFRVGDEYRLRMSFHVDKPIHQNHIYVYSLPSLLTGSTTALGGIYSHNGETIATVKLVRNELRISFTQYAESLINNGKSFTLQYDFRASLNASLIDLSGSYSLRVPSASGYDRVRIHVSNPQDDPMVDNQLADEAEEILQETDNPASNYQDDDAGLAVEENENHNPDANDKVDHFTYDMRQFVVNRSYGLFVLDNHSNPQLLQSRPFIIGEEYTLSVSFYVNAPVNPKREYTYMLPAVLLGKGHAAASTFTHDGQDIATVKVMNGRMTVMFTDYAAERLEAGQNIVLRYNFRETINNSVLGSAGWYSVRIPTRSGYDTVTVTVLRSEETEAEQGITAEIELPHTEQALMDAEANAETNNDDNDDLDQPNPEDMNDHETTDTCSAVTERDVIVCRYAKEVMHPGDIFSVTATLFGFDGLGYDVLWQYNDGGGWVDYHENGLILNLTADRMNVNYSWRIQLTLNGMNKECGE
jgi:hypothetical protein